MLDQILVDEEFPECQRLQCCCQSEHIENVADVKGNLHLTEFGDICMEFGDICTAD